MNEKDYKNAVVLPVPEALLLPRTTSYVFVQEFTDVYGGALSQPEKTHVALLLKDGAKGTAPEDFYDIGVTFRLRNHITAESGYLLEIEAFERVGVQHISFFGKHASADVTPYPDTVDLDDAMQEEMMNYLKDIVKEISSRFKGGEGFVRQLDSVKDINSMIIWLSRYMLLTTDDKYEYLKIDSLRERSLKFMDDLLKQKETVNWKLEINERISDKSSRYYRDQVLREQLAAIQEELGSEEESDGRKKKKDYKTRIEEAGMPQTIYEAAMDELDKLNSQPQGSAEVSVIQNYLDFMLALPWKKAEPKKADLARAEEILDEDHYGLEKVKKRIIEHLAVMQLKKDHQGSILLLVGPPGTGKTSLGKSIARALERKYVRLSFGGVRDEAEIRGHRRTYVGAMPGRILNGIKQAGCTNPVMVLDEVDKLMAGGFSGDPSSALLEVLDPEQNNTFADHYLDLPYDLSDVFFIATANTVATIPGPLLDRMEMIEISSYTEEEKFHIAKEHLIPQVLEETGLKPSNLKLSDETLHAIINDYTMEGGVRGLKKALLSVARSVSSELVTGKIKRSRTVKTKDLEDILGRKVSHHDKAQADNPAGVVTGLAWTPVGGEILFIEAADMPGSGQVVMTGKLGDVMQESARISLSLIKSRLPLNAVNFKERDIHIHVPSGAVPKDGPSAGITMLTALASLFTGIKADPHLAMTGEVTLRGAVMPIGGLKEKLLAANRAGIRKVLIPRENIPDLKEVPEEVRSEMKIVPVDTVEDVLKEALGITLPAPGHLPVNPDLFLPPEAAILSGGKRHPATR